MLHPKQKKYWEMSPLEKQLKSKNEYKDLTTAQILKLHHDEIYKYTMELQ